MKTNNMKILGFTDERTCCDLCGRIELKGTYVMEDEFGNIFHYGTTCGANASGYEVKEIKSEVKKIEIIKIIDSEISIAKSEHTKMKIYKKAIKKGYDKDTFFKKYGEIIESSPWEDFYSFCSIVHPIKK